MGEYDRRYLFEYNYDGCEWGIEIAARTPEEARERIMCLHFNGRLQGEIFATVKTPSWAHTIWRKACQIFHP